MPCATAIPTAGDVEPVIVGGEPGHASMAVETTLADYTRRQSVRGGRGAAMLPVVGTPQRIATRSGRRRRLGSTATAGAPAGGPEGQALWPGFRYSPRVCGNGVADPRKPVLR
jgi:hypothetical protein